MTTNDTSPARQRVRVWFGKHVICTHTADAESARLYAALMRRRFAGLRVTTETIDPARADTDNPGTPAPTTLPADVRLWPLTIR